MLLLPLHTQTQIQSLHKQMAHLHTSNATTKQIYNTIPQNNKVMHQVASQPSFWVSGKTLGAWPRLCLVSTSHYHQQGHATTKTSSQNYHSSSQHHTTTKLQHCSTATLQKYIATAVHHHNAASLPKLHHHKTNQSLLVGSRKERAGQHYTAASLPSCITTKQTFTLLVGGPERESRSIIAFALCKTFGDWVPRQP